MNSVAITEAAQATLAGTLPFPEIVAKLIAGGVEYYHVDYAGLSKQYYAGAGARVVTPIPFDDLPPPHRRPTHRVVPRRQAPQLIAIVA
jgi:hypothetical protein